MPNMPKNSITRPTKTYLEFRIQQLLLTRFLAANKLVRIKSLYIRSDLIKSINFTEEK